MALNRAVSLQLTTLLIELGERAGEVAGGYRWEQIGSRTSELFLVRETLDRSDAKGVSIPAALSVFPDELHETPWSWAEQAYPNLIHYNKLDTAGHFAAWQQSQLLSDEVRSAFRSLR